MVARLVIKTGKCIQNVIKLYYGKVKTTCLLMLHFFVQFNFSESQKNISHIETSTLEDFFYECIESRQKNTNRL